MLTQIYTMLVNYAIGGGVAAVVLFIFLYRKANKVASSGSKAKMLAFSLAPGLLVIVSLLASTAAFNFAVPRLQQAMNSPAVTGAVQAGGMAAQMVDSVLGPPVPNAGGMASFTVQPMQATGGFNPIPPGSGIWPQGGTLNLAPTLEPAMVPTVPALAPAANQLINYGNDGTYIVQRGDTLSSIAKAAYGDGDLWPMICNANSAVLHGNCSNIMAGMRLVIPDKASGDNRIVSGSSGNAPAYRVQNGTAFTGSGQQYISALNAANEKAVSEQQNGRAVNEAGQQFIDALNVAAQVTPTPRNLVFFPTAIPGATPTAHEFATR